MRTPLSFVEQDIRYDVSDRFGFTPTCRIAHPLRICCGQKTERGTLIFSGDDDFEHPNDSLIIWLCRARFSCCLVCRTLFYTVEGPASFFVFPSEGDDD